MDKVTAEKTLQIKENPYTKDILQKCYKSAVKKVHPDCGGSHEQMVQVNEAHTYLLTYFKYQESVSLSAQTTFNYNYQEEINKQEQRRKEAHARKVKEEVEKAAESMKEAARAANGASESFQDFADAYINFVYWTSRTNDTSENQWAKINQVVEEIEKEKEEKERAARNRKITIIAIICLRLLLVALAACTFIGFSGIDFVLHIGTFHFFDLYQGTAAQFLWTTFFLVVSVFNLWRGYFTDWIVSLYVIIEEKISSARERRKMSGAN